MNPMPGCPTCATRCTYIGEFSDGSFRCGRDQGHTGPHYSDPKAYPTIEQAHLRRSTSPKK